MPGAMDGAGGVNDERPHVADTDDVKDESKHELETEDDTTPLATQEGSCASASVSANQDDGGEQTKALPTVVLSDTSAHKDKSEQETQKLEPAHHAHHNQILAWESHTVGPHYRSLSRRTLDFMHSGSTQSSSGSLHALSEDGEEQSNLRRAPSTRSTRSGKRVRSISVSKAPSHSTHSGSKRPWHGENFYPDQSFAQLSNPILGSRPAPVLRTRSSHPAQNLLYNDMSKSKAASTPGRRTADNTPISSPGLFTLAAVRQSHTDSIRSASPQLHHLQTPQETHTAKIEHDVAGNKFINNYEVVQELGRGEHGKVKLGRDIERETVVAIKIVPRFSAKRRLGQLGAPEDRTKREVAILKKARHPNVVSLLEVIDDPNKNKVYLILEYVDKGEIKWRKSGVKEILAVNNLRFEQERLGYQLSIDPTDKDHHIVRQARIQHERLEQLRQHKDLSHIPNWSLEYAGDTDDESEIMEMSRTVSRQNTRESFLARGGGLDDYVGLPEPSLAGSMYGAYTPDAYRARKFSVAASAVSHMSSDVGFELDDDQHSFVPALTLEEARRAFRDTLVGLDFLHLIGIIHRDIKPANLLTCSNGMVKISDFGVSYLGRPTNDDEAEEKADVGTTVVDNEKELARSVGTPAFWAPELCYEDPAMFSDGKEPKITGALDLWALGITLYCMIYARLPFYLNDEMGLHEAICTATPFCPATRLVPVDTTSSNFISQSNVPINGNKRLDYELKFEHVPEAVRDLIQQLLIKDPAQRITIAQAKRHPWVVEGLEDEEEWLQGPLAKETKKQILDVNEKEMNHAVVKRNIIERALSTAGRLAGSLLGRRDSRKRATSAANSAGSSSESLQSPTGSTTSTIGKTNKPREDRRKSLRGDEFVHALKASRETNEHPLAQSQTASPDTKDGLSYFEPPRAASTGGTPIEVDRRPRGPDRAVSALSTAESVKTIRASQQRSWEQPYEASLRSKFEGLWEGTAKSLARLSHRDGHHNTRSRSSSRPPSESDGHANPSLAVSNTYAAGSIARPNVLGTTETTSGSDSGDFVDAVDVLTPHPLTQGHSPASEDLEQVQHANPKRQSHDEIKPTEVQERLSDTPTCIPSQFDGAIEEDTASATMHISPDSAMQTAVSASTIASSADEFCGSSVSNPSYGIASGASSPPEGFSLAEHKDIVGAELASTEPDFMRTADTITAHGAVAPGKPLEEQHEFYDAGIDDSDDSDDEVIMMGAPKRG